MVGAGAIGSYYAALLTRAGHDVRLLARGAHLDALRAAGLAVTTADESYTVAVAASDVAADLAGADYAIVAVKSYSLGEVGPLLAELARGGATVVPLLNGIDIEDRLVALGVARDRVLPGLTTISVVRTAPGKVERRSAFQRVVVGEVSGEESARAASLSAILDGAGISTRVSADIRLDLWRKFVFLAPIAAACGLTREPIGAVRASAMGRPLLVGAVREILDVGSRLGVPWSTAEEETTLGAIDALAPAMKPSFLLDLERGGPTELDVLSETVARLGRELGVATPVHARAAATLGGVAPA